MTTTPTPLSPLDSAIAIARKGFPIFPVTGKRPNLKNWPKLATTDEATIAKWWGKWPNANIGIHTADLLVIDVDGPAGHANIARIQRIAKLPVTAISRSGRTSESHHYQIIYRLPRHQRLKNKPLEKFAAFAVLGPKAKIDIKTTGGYVVAPGSMHQDGGQYAWENEPDAKDSLPLAPFWLVAMLSEGDETRKPCRKPNAGEGQEEALPVIDDKGLFPDGEVLVLEKDFDFYAAQTIKRYSVEGPGQRNSQMAAAVASLFHRGLHPKDVIRVMTYWLKAYQDQYATDYETAKDELLACLDRTIENIAGGKFDRARTSHYDQTDHIELPAAAIAKLDQTFKPGSLDWKFAEAVAILSSYPANRNEQGQLVFIRSDIQRLIRTRHGTEADNTQIERMKRKYVTREKEGHASVLELLVEKQKGYRSLRTGKAAPSVYAVSSFFDVLRSNKTERGDNNTEPASVISSNAPGSDKTERGDNTQEEIQAQREQQTERGDNRREDKNTCIRAEYGGVGDEFEKLLQDFMKEENERC